MSDTSNLTPRFARCTANMLYLKEEEARDFSKSGSQYYGGEEIRIFLSPITCIEGDSLFRGECSKFFSFPSICHILLIYLFIFSTCFFIFIIFSTYFFIFLYISHVFLHVSTYPFTFLHISYLLLFIFHIFLARKKKVQFS